MLTDKQDYDEIYQKYKNLVMKAAYKYSGNYDRSPLEESMGES